MKIQIERFSQSLHDEAYPLLKAHWQEIALHRDEVPLDVDVAFYLTMQERERLLCLTLRDEERLAGYSLFFMNLHHPHYQQLATATNDVIFIDPSLRAKGAVRLIRASETAVRQWVGSGKYLILWHAKLANDFSVLLRKLGYDQQEIALGRLFV